MTHTLIPCRYITDVLTPTPIECPLCGTMATWFRNQRGQSYCIHCAPKDDSADVPASWNA